MDVCANVCSMCVCVCATLCLVKKCLNEFLAPNVFGCTNKAEECLRMRCKTVHFTSSTGSKIAKFQLFDLFRNLNRVLMGFYFRFAA